MKRLLVAAVLWALGLAGALTLAVAMTWLLAPSGPAVIMASVARGEVFARDVAGWVSLYPATLRGAFERTATAVANGTP